jgi:hypothetical protein
MANKAGTGRMKAVRQEYHEMLRYLMWDGMPLFLRDTYMRNGQEEDQIQQWIPAALDLLSDNGFIYQLTTCYDNLGDKRLKQKDELFSHMLNRLVCTWDNFQDFFEVQYYFTSVPHSVRLSTYVHKRHTDRAQSQHISIVKTSTRKSLGVAIGRDPGLETFPAPKYPLGFTHSATPAE